ncbi:MAG: glycosyltransferase [Candidatus Devosia phytovorans]|uniref:Glycosyltransferase n=1 Tax=Candidatus Devosia phytovorans TaxID=3121372 RepID=A0AAJ5VUB7_9HYPH|nr:glycosyltransferase [Devosia sp.]WEK03737.1 MAG: glycosyltransferase [Devosia sp.]
MTFQNLPARIAYATGEYPKVSHTFIQREIEALRQQGLSVETFSIRRPASSSVLSDQRTEEEQTYYVLENCKRLGIFLGAHLRKLVRSPAVYFQVLSLAWRMRSPGLKGLLYQIFYFAESVLLADELNRRGITHLHNHFGDSSCTVAMLASVLSGVPYSFTEHGPTIFFEAGKWRLDEKIARARFVVAISHFCRSQLMLFSAPEHWDKIAIVHCGVIPERYAFAPKTSASKHLVYVGRLEPVKGLLVLLDAVANLRQRHPDLQLTIVGDGTSRPGIEATARELGLAGITRFVGYRTSAEVAAHLADADLLVLPSFAEGVPVVLMEAMASGRPVIASRVAGVQELVQDGIAGFTVPPGDVTTLAQRIEQLITDPALCARMGHAGRQIVEREFSIAAEARRLGDLMTGPGTPAPLRIGARAETANAG